MGNSTFASAVCLASRLKLWKRVWELQEKPGLSAAVYTQTTDVETEANGLMTYDRAVIKQDTTRTPLIHSGRLPALPRVK